ncbi:galactoside alpha-(1,2)-fucosyltransferase 2-like [Gopherus flavomarginatus]|uniref:galactoside alpha-(1,2)-fucosyltransferase 2-like n=1 Tax=Gopherus flavomarginatus TaxID=286002 RepID=UPI0021CC091B|nr:galactoside alpha-(1,2)-fucosyltransferase 2-like [Gopherus flavomarginatus]
MGGSAEPESQPLAPGPDWPLPSPHPWGQGPMGPPQPEAGPLPSSPGPATIRHLNLDLYKPLVSQDWILWPGWNLLPFTSVMAASISWVPFWSPLRLSIFLLAIMTTSIFLHRRGWFPARGQRLPSSNAMGRPPAMSLILPPTTPPATEQGMWTVHSAGRLGNQMGEYATLYALAKMNGRQAYILPQMHQQLAPLFRITLPVLSSDVVRNIRWRNYGLHNWMSEEYRHIKGKYVRLTGYPCSWTFYHHLRQEILQEFSFHDHIKEEANRYLAGLRGQRQNVTYMGIHVRRGDYVRVMPQVRKGVVADKAYLEKAMGYFRAKYQEPVFVVTSNGMEWCRENIDASWGDVYFSGDGKESSPGRDFALLVHCNHTIMTIGTFGIWASYLAGGETIYLANYMLPNSPYLRHFKPSAAFLPEWIGIDADLSPLLNGSYKNNK